MGTSTPSKRNTGSRTKTGSRVIRQVKNQNGCSRAEKAAGPSTTASTRVRVSAPRAYSIPS